MLKTIIAYLWTKFEPTKEERIAAARKLLESTGFHIHADPVKVKQKLPLLEIIETKEDGIK